MRKEPSAKYIGLPCSYVGTGCAYEDIYHKEFAEPIPENLREDGWLTLDNTNKYVRSILKVTKKDYYPRSERKTLIEFLRTNKSKCLVCVYGHFIYVNGKDYWSFFCNETDEVVCVWYLA